MLCIHADLASILIPGHRRIDHYRFIPNLHRYVQSILPRTIADLEGTLKILQIFREIIIGSVADRIFSHPLRPIGQISVHSYPLYRHGNRHGSTVGLGGEGAKEKEKNKPENFPFYSVDVAQHWMQFLR